MQKTQQTDGFFVPNTFVQSKMLALDDMSVKVYLYARCLAQQNGDKVSCDALYDVFRDRDCVQKALRTLVQCECLFVDKHAIITFQRLPSAEKPQYSQSQIAQSVDRDEQLQMLMQAAEQVLGKMLTVSAIESLYGMYDWLGLPVEVILKLLEYCVGIGKKSMAYIEKVAITWHKEGIVTPEAAQAYLTSESEKRSFVYKAKQIFGIDNRNFTSKEEGYVRKWQAMGVSEALLSFAFDYTVDNTGKLAFAYMDKVLSAWKEAGANTPQQAQKFIDAYKQENTEKEKPVVKRNIVKPEIYGTGKYNYEEIRRRARENIRQKIGKE